MKRINALQRQTNLFYPQVSATGVHVASVIQVGQRRSTSPAFDNHLYWSEQQDCRFETCAEQQQCCGIVIDHYATSGQIAVHDQIREFKVFVSSPSHYAKLMTTAEYQLKETRQRQNRRSTTAITSTVSFVQARKVALAHITRHVGVRLASPLRLEGSPLVDRPVAAEQK